MKAPTIKKVDSVSVARFYENYGGTLELQLCNSPLGMSRKILQPTLNRPGLALAGYFSYFAHERIQVFGAAEMAYMSTMEGIPREERIRRLFAENVPCLIFTRGVDIPRDVLELADEYSVSVFLSPLPTVKLVNRATIILDNEFAESTTLHGCMVDVNGVGVLLTGDSGIGKSETAIELVKRGHRLIADDAVEIKRVSSKTLVGSAPELIKYYIELRGIGVVDVRRIFGMGSVKATEKIDLVINLEPWDAEKLYDRFGLDEEFTEILGINVPSLTIPVKPGRNLAIILEIAAMNNRQKKMGYNTAQELNERLMSLDPEQMENMM